MKKVIGGLIAAGLLPLLAVGQDATAMKYQALLATSMGSSTGAWVDVSAYKGHAQFLVVGGPGVTNSANYVNTVTINHSATTNGTFGVATNLAGVASSFRFAGTSGTWSNWTCDLSRMKKYILIKAVHSGDDTGPSAVHMIAPMKSE